MKMEFLDYAIKILGLLCAASIPFSYAVYKILDFSLNKKYVSKSSLEELLKLYVTLDRLNQELKALDEAIKGYSEKISNKIDDSIGKVHKRIDDFLTSFLKQT